MIEPREISVVAQGPIVGKPGDPAEERLTAQCLESVRRFLPGAELVLSTWKGADVSGLTYDRLIESDDPGAIFCDAGQFAPRILYNANRQIISTRAGLRAATKPYAVKLRSDMTLTGTGFLDYFRRYNARNEAWQVLRERVVTGTFYARNPRRRFAYPFHPSDWFYFGLREDVLNIWDIPLAPEPEMPRWFDTHTRPPEDTETWAMYRYTVEQYIWLNFLRKHGEIKFEHKLDLSNDAINVSELTLANNLVLAESTQLGIKFMKYPVSKADWATLYTHGEWLRLYKKYCDSSVRVTPDVLLWRKKVEMIGHNAFAAMHEARHSAVMDSLRAAWERRSPGSLRVAKRIFQVAFDKPRARAMFEKTGKRKT